MRFDIDGTLTESSALDFAAYPGALRESLGLRDVSDNWATYQHVTYGGILAEVFQKRLGRLPTLEETDVMQNKFTALLAERINAVGGLRPMAGAAEILAHLAALPDDYAVAYASGGRGKIARLKLRSAGLPAEEVPGAFADDDSSREGICQAAHHRAEERHGHALLITVCVGDGVWDVRTSRQLGYGFIGIGRDAAKLRAESAAEVLADFRDAGAFLTALLRSAGTAAPAR